MLYWNFFACIIAGFKLLMNINKCCIETSNGLQLKKIQYRWTLTSVVLKLFLPLWTGLFLKWWTLTSVVLKPSQAEEFCWYITWWTLTSVVLKHKSKICSGRENLRWTLTSVVSKLGANCTLKSWKSLMNINKCCIETAHACVPYQNFLLMNINKCCIETL